MIRYSRYFIIVSAAMVLFGTALALGGTAVGLGPIAFVCGVLLLWSGIVKMIVLRIWQATLPGHQSSEGVGVNDGTKRGVEHPL